MQDAHIWTYFPEKSLPYIQPWFKKYNFDFIVSRNRTSKYGDFRPSNKYGRPQISINSNLNPYHFLITFTHELCHLLIWQKHKNTVKPHGNEWKRLFSDALMYLLKKNIFPAEIEEQLYHYALNPKASTATHQPLLIALRKFDDTEGKHYLKDQPLNQKFKINNKTFVLKKKLRTRCLCTEIFSGKQYYVHALTEIQIVEK